MAGLKEAILSIVSRCATVPGVAFTHIWNNQLNQEVEGQMYDFPKPAVFVEAQTPNQFLPIGNAYSQSDIYFVIHIVHEQYDAGGGNFEQNTAVFDLRSAIIKKLNYFRPAMCSGLMKWAEAQDYEHTNLYHYTITFLTGLIDDAGVPDAGPTATGSDLNVSLVEFGPAGSEYLLTEQEDFLVQENGDQLIL